MSEAPEMHITALAPWYGSKRTLAPRIVAECGEHKFYVEPFCGSMAVLLAKPECGMEMVNDLHGDLINLARVLASDRAPDMYAMASRVLMHEGMHTEAKATIKGTPCDPAPSSDSVGEGHVKRALAYFTMSWLGRNGGAGTQLSNITHARRYTSNGGSAGIRWRSAVDSIPAWHERLRAVAIVNMDGFTLLDRLSDQDGTVIYVDPPYVRKSDKYIHDFKTEDHARLADRLKRFRRTRVIVSYYDEPELHELYRGWTVVHCPVTKAMVNQGQRDENGAVQAPEILLINGPSLTAGGGLFA